MTTNQTPPEPMIRALEVALGLDPRAGKPGASVWKWWWGETRQGREQLVIEFDPAWWDRGGDVTVLVEGKSMTRRDADVLYLKRILDAIAARERDKQPQFHQS